MKYVNICIEKERKEFEAYIHNIIGKYLISETGALYGRIRKYEICKKDIALVENIMNKYNITTYFFVKKNVASDNIELKILEQYPIKDRIKEKKRYNNLSQELWKIKTGYSSCEIDEHNKHEFKENRIGKEFYYIILEKKYEDDARNIVKHVMGVDLEIKYVDAVNLKYEINGLIWFKIGVNKTDQSLYYKVFHMLSRCNINFCHYSDKGGQLNLILHMIEEESNTSRPKFRNDLQLILRSSWEANIARILNHLRVKWEYEKESFLLELDENLIPRSYLPDFFLNKNVIIEVKGFWDERSLEKVALFKEKYREYKLLIIDSDMYYTLDNIYSNIIPEWEQSPVKIKYEKVPMVGREKHFNQIGIDECVSLQREPENLLDKNTILVVNKSGKTIGNIRKEWSAVYADKMDLGMKYKAIIKEKDDKVYNVLLERTNIDEEILFPFLKDVVLNTPHDKDGSEPY